MTNQPSPARNPIAICARDQKKIFRFLIPEQSKSCGVTECAVPVSIHPKDRLRRRIQEEPDSLLTFVQCLLSALPVPDFLFQFRGAFIDALLQILAGMPQLGIPVLNLFQHFVKPID